MYKLHYNNKTIEVDGKLSFTFQSFSESDPSAKKNSVSKTFSLPINSTTAALFNLPQSSFTITTAYKYDGVILEFPDLHKQFNGYLVISSATTKEYKCNFYGDFFDFFYKLSDVTWVDLINERLTTYGYAKLPDLQFMLQPQNIILGSVLWLNTGIENPDLPLPIRLYSTLGYYPKGETIEHVVTWNQNKTRLQLSSGNLTNVAATDFSLLNFRFSSMPILLSLRELAELLSTALSYQGGYHIEFSSEVTDLLMRSYIGTVRVGDLENYAPNTKNAYFPSIIDALEKPYDFLLNLMKTFNLTWSFRQSSSLTFVTIQKAKTRTTSRTPEAVLKKTSIEPVKYASGKWNIVSEGTDDFKQNGNDYILGSVGEGDEDTFVKVPLKVASTGPKFVGRIDNIYSVVGPVFDVFYNNKTHDDPNFVPAKDPDSGAFNAENYYDTGYNAIPTSAKNGAITDDFSEYSIPKLPQMPLLSTSDGEPSEIKGVIFGIPEWILSEGYHIPTLIGTSGSHKINSIPLTITEVYTISDSNNESSIYEEKKNVALHIPSISTGTPTSVSNGVVNRTAVYKKGKSEVCSEGFMVNARIIGVPMSYYFLGANNTALSNTYYSIYSSYGSLISAITRVGKKFTGALYDYPSTLLDDLADNSYFTAPHYYDIVDDDGSVSNLLILPTKIDLSTDPSGSTIEGYILDPSLTTPCLMHWTGNGTFTRSGAQVPEYETYNSGDTVPATKFTPSSNYTFTKWSDNVTSTTHQSFTISSDTNLTAITTYTPPSYVVTIHDRFYQSSSRGFTVKHNSTTITPTGADWTLSSFQYGDTVTITLANRWFFVDDVAYYGTATITPPEGARTYNLTIATSDIEYENQDGTTLACYDAPTGVGVYSDQATSTLSDVRDANLFCTYHFIPCENSHSEPCNGVMIRFNLLPYADVVTCYEEADMVLLSLYDSNNNLLTQGIHAKDSEPELTYTSSSSMSHPTVTYDLDDGPYNLPTDHDDYSLSPDGTFINFFHNSISEAVTVTYKVTLESAQAVITFAHQGAPSTADPIYHIKLNGVVVCTARPGVQYNLTPGLTYTVDYTSIPTYYAKLYDNATELPAFSFQATDGHTISVHWSPNGNLLLVAPDTDVPYQYKKNGTNVATGWITAVVDDVFTCVSERATFKWSVIHSGTEMTSLGSSYTFRSGDTQLQAHIGRPVLFTSDMDKPSSVIGTHDLTLLEHIACDEMNGDAITSQAYLFVGATIRISFSEEFFAAVGTLRLYANGFDVTNDIIYESESDTSYYVIPDYVLDTEENQISVTDIHLAISMPGGGGGTSVTASTTESSTASTFKSLTIDGTTWNAPNLKWIIPGYVLDSASSTIAHFTYAPLRANFDNNFGLHVIGHDWYIIDKWTSSHPGTDRNLTTNSTNPNATTPVTYSMNELGSRDVYVYIPYFLGKTVYIPTYQSGYVHVKDDTAVTPRYIIEHQDYVGSYALNYLITMDDPYCSCTGYTYTNFEGESKSVSGSSVQVRSKRYYFEVTPTIVRATGEVENVNDAGQVDALIYTYEDPDTGNVVTVTDSTATIPQGARVTLDKNTFQVGQGYEIRDYCIVRGVQHAYSSDGTYTFFVSSGYTSFEYGVAEITTDYYITRNVDSLGDRYLYFGSGSSYALEEGTTLRKLSTWLPAGTYKLHTYNYPSGISTTTYNVNTSPASALSVVDGYYYFTHSQSRNETIQLSEYVPTEYYWYYTSPSSSTKHYTQSGLPTSGSVVSSGVPYTCTLSVESGYTLPTTAIEATNATVTKNSSTQYTITPDGTGNVSLVFYPATAETSSKTVYFTSSGTYRITSNSGDYEFLVTTGSTKIKVFSDGLTPFEINDVPNSKSYGKFAITGDPNTIYIDGLTLETSAITAGAYHFNGAGMEGSAPRINYDYLTNGSTYTATIS